MCGGTRLDRVRNGYSLGVRDIAGTSIIEEARLRCFGDVLRNPQVYSYMENRYPAGAQKAMD